MKFKYETQLRFEWHDDLIEEKREKLDGKYRDAREYLEKQRQLNLSKSMQKKEFNDIKM